MQAFVSLRAMFKLPPGVTTAVLRNGLYYECWDEYWDAIGGEDFLVRVHKHMQNERSVVDFCLRVRVI